MICGDVNHMWELLLGLNDLLVMSEQTYKTNEILFFRIGLFL